LEPDGFDKVFDRTRLPFWLLCQLLSWTGRQASGCRDCQPHCYCDQGRGRLLLRAGARPGAWTASARLPGASADGGSVVPQFRYAPH